MSAPPSFERFDYLLRSNKQIERKLLFDLLVRSRKFVKYEEYRYLGLGSMWFVDHRMAHRLLGIDHLYSIEKGEHASRAEFNRPYGCIEVWPGDVSDVLKNMPAQDWAQPYVVWLYYDGALLPSVVATRNSH